MAARLTPVERAGAFWLKRDDLFEFAGVRGGKVRTCQHLAAGEHHGLVTAGSRASPQVNIVAQVAQALGLPCRAHCPQGELSPELLAAQAAGAEIIQHRAGYNSVIRARAREDAAARGWLEIPFGMECQAAVEQTASQVANLPPGIQRIIVSVGSGMSLAGILTGLERAGATVPVVGIVAGANPERRLDRFAPVWWRAMATLVPAGVPYHREATAALNGTRLDSIYEAKCVRFLQPGDLFWLVGIRATQK